MVFHAVARGVWVAAESTLALGSSDARLAVWRSVLFFPLLRAWFADARSASGEGFSSLLSSHRFCLIVSAHDVFALACVYFRFRFKTGAFVS